MAKEPIYPAFIKYLDKTAYRPGWVAAGVVSGIPCWIWGESSWPVKLFKSVSGFDWLLVAPGAPLVILSLMAFYLKEPVGRLAYGGFQIALYWVHPKLMRAISVLFGLVLIAAVCWVVTGSINALKTALLGAMLSGELFIYWVGLAVIANELSKRFASANL